MPDWATSLETALGRDAPAVHKAHGVPAAAEMPSPTAYDSKSSVNNWPCAAPADTTSAERRMCFMNPGFCVLVFHAKIGGTMNPEHCTHEMGGQRAQNVFRGGLGGTVHYEWRGKDVLEDMPMCPVNEWIGQEVRVSFEGVIGCVETGKAIKKTW